MSVSIKIPLFFFNDSLKNVGLSVCHSSSTTVRLGKEGDTLHLKSHSPETKSYRGSPILVKQRLPRHQQTAAFQTVLNTRVITQTR